MFLRCLILSSLLVSSVQELIGQLRSEAPVELNILDPETVYSFTGLNGEGFLRRRPVNLPQPIYLGSATGIVPLTFMILPDGSTQEVRIDPPLLPGTRREMVTSAIKSVEQWQFEPLPEAMRQELMAVKVVLQYNRQGSGVLYASDGSCTMRGLAGRRPAHIYAPDWLPSESGIVNAVVGLNADGTVHGIYRYFGVREEVPVPASLGILTYETLKQWTFDPALPPEEDVEEEWGPSRQEIIVTLRFSAARSDEREELSRLID